MAKSPNILGLWAIVALAMITACATAPELYAPEVARMDAESVKARINSEGFNLIDARYDSDWESSDRMIAGAVREDPYEVSEWAPKYSKTEAIVVYCAWPNEETSASVVLRLEELGYGNVFVLSGGWRKWDARGYPSVPKK